jgi:hypothetical protein
MQIDGKEFKFERERERERERESGLGRKAAAPNAGWLASWLSWNEIKFLLGFCDHSFYQGS